MSFFQRDHYRSEATQFIDKLKSDKPELEKSQLAGRALLWDKQVDLQLQTELKKGKVAQKPYVYSTNP